MANFLADARVNLCVAGGTLGAGKICRGQVRAQNEGHLVGGTVGLMLERILFQPVPEGQRKKDGNDCGDDSAEKRKGRQETGFPAK